MLQAFTTQTRIVGEARLCDVFASISHGHFCCFTVENLQCCAHISLFTLHQGAPPGSKYNLRVCIYEDLKLHVSYKCFLDVNTPSCKRSVFSMGANVRNWSVTRVRGV